MARDYLMFFRNRPIARGILPGRERWGGAGAACGWVGAISFSFARRPPRACRPNTGAGCRAL